MEAQPKMRLGGTAGDPVAGTAEEPVGADGRGAGRRGRSPRAGGGVLRSSREKSILFGRWTGCSADRWTFSARSA
jgi:hypothetical protein